MSIQGMTGAILYECVSGSKAYGLSSPESDTDIKGVFIAAPERFFGFSYENQISNETNDVTYYEIGRFFELLCKSNPTVLEMLYTPDECILKGHEFLRRIDPARFLSRKCEDSFARYAFTQIRKARGLNKKISNPIGEAKKSIRDFCFTFHGQGSVLLAQWLADNGFEERRCGLTRIQHMENMYALFYDTTDDLSCGFNGLLRSEASMDLTLSSVPKNMKPVMYVYFNKNSFSQYCKEYKEYWEWVLHRNDARYQTTIRHGRNYDSKNMMHTFRLLEIAEEIALHRKIFVRRNDREELLKIKAGHYSYEELLERADNKLKRIEQLYAESGLPDEPDRAYAEELLVSIRKEYYRE